MTAPAAHIFKIGLSPWHSFRSATNCSTLSVASDISLNPCPKGVIGTYTPRLSTPTENRVRHLSYASNCKWYSWETSTTAYAITSGCITDPDIVVRYAPYLLNRPLVARSEAQRDTLPPSGMTKTKAVNSRLADRSIKANTRSPVSTSGSALFSYHSARERKGFCASIRWYRKSQRKIFALAGNLSACSAKSCKSFNTLNLMLWFHIVRDCLLESPVN